MKWAAGAVLGLIIAVGLMPLPFWSAPLQRSFEEQVARTTGLAASAGGRTVIAILPYPRVSFEDVVIGRSDGPVSLRVDRVTAEMSVARLLVGEIAFTGLRLLRPRGAIDTAAPATERSRAIQQAIDAPPSSDEARAADQARVGAIRIVNGSLQVRVGETFVALVDNINAKVDWPNLGSTATLSGRANWRGERFEIDALLRRPAEALRGEKSAFTAKLSSRLMDFALDGSVAGGARWILDARIAANSERLSQFLAHVDAQPPVPGRLARFALSGQLRALPQSASLSDLRLAIDGNTLDGSIAVLTGGKRPKITGTLAARTYDMPAEDAGLPVLSRERQWSRDAIPIGRLDAFDADLRVSASRLNLGRLTLTDAGFVIALDDGLLEVTTAGAEAYGGALRARWRFNTRTATPELDGAGSFRNINLSSLLRAAGYSAMASGSATGEFDLATRGSSVQALMQHVSGNLRAAVRTPEVVGVDLERALRRTERRPLSIPTELRTGQTSFASAELEARIDEGVLLLERATATGPGVEVAVEGQASLPDRTLRMEIAARQPRTSKPADGRDPPTLILDIEGPWEDPALSIDPDSLIKRSEAAAPLWRRQPAPEPAVAPTER